MPENIKEKITKEQKFKGGISKEQFKSEWKAMHSNAQVFVQKVGTLLYAWSDDLDDSRTIMGSMGTTFAELAIAQVNEGTRGVRNGKFGCWIELSLHNVCC